MVEAKPIRALLADDHVVVRRGIRGFLEEEPGIQVVDEAGSGEEAMELVVKHQPDVVLMDIQMPGMGGVEATRQIKERFPQVKVLVLTAYDNDPYVFALLQAGADGYILKTSDAEELVRAVRTVAGGGSALGPEIAQTVVRQIATGRPEGARGQIELLSSRELEVLRLAAKGLTNKEIGHALGISDRTVQGHLASIYGKLGVGSRTEATTEALKRGWIVVE